MKLSTIVFVFFFLLNQAFAQQEHFLYIESESKKPFYARIGQKPYSSSQAGYLIIPKLSKGVIDFSIGFPRNEWAPQPFTLDISGDAGYLLRLSAESRWELISLKDFSTIHAGEKKAAAVVQEKNETPAQGVAKDTVAYVDSAAAQKTVYVEKVDKQEPAIVPAIGIISRTTGVSGFMGWYIIPATGDTVDIEIPAGMPVQADTAAVSGTQRLGVNEKLPLGEDSVQHVNTQKPVVQKTAEPQMGAVASGNGATLPATCRALASMNDFLRLRKNMAAQLTEEAMSEVARKFLKTKCISTQQASNLGALYLTDQGRYAFFDTCYEHVSDPASFATLEKQLTDPYYINRFRAMLR